MGMSDVVTKFLKNPSKSQKVVNMTIYDAEHYTDEQKEQIIASYPEHEREARARGIPTMGSGRIFQITESQSLASPLDVKTSYSVDGIQVVGARNTGWTTATGTPLLGSFNANQSYTVGTTYTQSEVAALATGLQQARQRILALETALRLHGLID